MFLHVFSLYGKARSALKVFASASFVRGGSSGRIPVLYLSNQLLAVPRHANIWGYSSELPPGITGAADIFRALTDKNRVLYMTFLFSGRDTSIKNTYSTVILPPEEAGFSGLGEVLQYRDLIFLFVKRDFISKYKQTVLGPLWAILQPLLTTVVFTVIFGNLARLTTADVPAGPGVRIPSFLFYMAGTICWTYFSTVVSVTSNTFINNRRILGKVYFPRLVMPISSALSGLISFGIQLVMFLFMWAFFLIRGDTGMFVSPFLALVPLLILQMVLLGMGFGILVSSLTTKYRDLAMLVSFGLQLWHYGTPVAYGLQLIPEKYTGLIMLNPMTMVIVTFRRAFFGTGYFHPIWYLTGWLITILVLILGSLLFGKVERTFMDTI